MQPTKFWRIVELLQTTTEFFQKKSIENPRLNAELLLCKVLEIQRVDLYVNYDRPISSEELQIYRDYIRRRASREPLQYILGQTEFMSLTFKVNPSILIPRQDTETLVEWVLDRFNGRRNLKILDLGTGSGNIAISLAHYLNEPQITAIDISQEALESAKENASINKVNDCVSFIQCDVLDSRCETIMNDRFDIIVANPPYIPEKEYMQLEPEVKEHEPRIALLDQNNGDAFFHRICELAPQLLKNNGEVFVEMAAGQSERVESIFKKYRFKFIQIRKDIAGIERVILAKFEI